jgi:hypothetical protein
VQLFGIRLHPEPAGSVARNDLAFTVEGGDDSGADHDALGAGLRKALYNYLHGVGLELDVREWFDDAVPPATVPPSFVDEALAARS